MLLNLNYLNVFGVFQRTRVGVVGPVIVAELGLAGVADDGQKVQLVTLRHGAVHSQFWKFHDYHSLYFSDKKVVLCLSASVR